MNIQGKLPRSFKSCAIEEVILRIFCCVSTGLDKTAAFRGSSQVQRYMSLNGKGKLSLSA